MKAEFKVLIDEELKRNFEMALQLNSEEKDSVLDALLRGYVSRAFLKAAAAYERPSAHVEKIETGDFTGKAVQRIPKWAKKPGQINHKIIRAYLQLSAKGTVTYNELLKYCTEDETRTDIYVPTFASNFAQMKFDGEKSHGRVFDVGPSGVVTIWDGVESVLLNYRDDFVAHTTDEGYINKNGQRNMGRTTIQGTDFGQNLYVMRCEHCKKEYFANGTDIFLKKCPQCQGGANTGFTQGRQ